MPDGDGAFWVFGYGSLMWNPGFDHGERRRARLHGYRRRPCVASVHYRGAPDRPGVVMGLDRGGACRGFAYRVAAEAVAGVVGYLDARELIYPVYRRRRLPVTVFDDSGARRRVTALTYVVDRADPLYLGDRDLACLAACGATARGVAGSSLAYLRQVLHHLHEMGIRDRRLEALLAAVAAVPRGDST